MDNQRIKRCESSNNSHTGKWILTQTHPTGIPMADELCPHFQTREQACEALREERDGERVMAERHADDVSKPNSPAPVNAVGHEGRFESK